MTMTTSQKLRMKEGDLIQLVGTPDDYPSRLGELPAGVRFQTGMAENPAAIHWLVSTTDELAARFPELLPELEAARHVWILYPRKKKYAHGDANRDSIWNYLKTQNWKAVANYPADDTYSAVWAKPAG